MPDHDLRFFIVHGGDAWRRQKVDVTIGCERFDDKRKAGASGIEAPARDQWRFTKACWRRGLPGNRQALKDLSERAGGGRQPERGCA